MKSISLKTGAWYGDRSIELEVPSGWDIDTLWPATPPPLTHQELAGILEKPVGQLPIRELCQGKSRPLIIVDDLNRPTPVADLMPLLLEILAAAKIPRENITILMATGTHGKPGPDALLKKVGKEAAGCRLLIHDCFNDVEKIGSTSYGTPVFANRAVKKADLVIGVSGIYPNHSAGFGGGSKLALGVLGIRTIYHLHFGHPSISWGEMQPGNSFRNELDEIALMIGMKTNLSLMIDADRRIIRLYCGDQKKYFQEAVSYYLKTFSVKDPADADVVFSNTYPNDLSLTFARMKGFVPLKQCGRGVSRIAMAGCDEGLGLHNIWPFVNLPLFHKQKHILRVLSVMPLREISAKALAVLKRKLLSDQVGAVGLREEQNRVWLYQTGDRVLPANVPGMIITSDWQRIVEGVRREQANRESLRVAVYPCAFLQVPRRSC